MNKKEVSIFNRVEAYFFCLLAFHIIHSIFIEIEQQYFTFYLTFYIFNNIKRKRKKKKLLIFELYFFQN
jgi:hypothetical protein